MLETFFALLRSGLWGEPLSDFKPLKEKEWKEVLTLAKKQTVLGLVADAISRLPKEVAPSEETMTSLLKFSARSVMTHGLLDSSVAKVVGFYRSHGIEGVLLKGQGIARCYPKPLLRQCGDIDFYIGKTNYQESVDLAIKHLESGEKEAKESRKHYHFDMDNVTVELHRIAAEMATPWLSKDFHRWLVAELEDKSRLRKIEIKDTEVNVPSSDFNAFFIFYHVWWHLLHGGIGLRQLCDWAMALNSNADQIDRKALEERLRRWRCVRPWQILGSIVVEKLGLAADKMPLYDLKIGGKYNWVMDKVIDGGNFGFHNNYMPETKLRKMPLLKRKMILLKRMARTHSKVFPVIPLESSCIVLRTLSLSGIHTVKQIITGK